MHLIIYFVLLFPSFLASPDRTQKCSWENCPPWPSSSVGMLNVHIVAHTHDDMGWIKTVDDYYTGAKRQLVPVGVQFIINTVVDELHKDPARRFSYAETGFLKRWLDDHKPEQRRALHKLVTETGQFELIGGGWTQPDEANTHYIDLIDQYSLGLGILNATYGKCGLPKIAWQIDPFGHSREHANLVALMGYEGLFFARMHYAELERRAKAKQLEMVWSASDELKTNILTGGFLRGTYSPPPEFCFDSLCADEPIVDNPMFEGYNLEAKLERFFNIVREEASTQKHSHVMLTMGGDFQYSNANMWFSQLDKLIEALNSHSNASGIRAQYSTPSCYMAALIAAQPHLPPKQQGDFFPYASSNHSYWTGYFTSKPAIKRLIRVSSSLLQLARRFAAFAGRNDAELGELERALALSTHHDAVTGTSKENVTKDYSRRLLKGWDGAESSLISSFWQLAQKNGTMGPSFPWVINQQKPLQFCREQNDTVCLASKSMTNFTLVLFNSNNQPADKLVLVPFYRKSAKVLNGNGTEVNSVLIKTFLRGNEQPMRADAAPFQLAFQAQIPALGFTTFFVLSSDQRQKQWRRSGQRREKTARRRENKIAVVENGSAVISNNDYRLTFGSDGLLSSLMDLRRNKTYKIRQEFFYYRGMTKGINDTQQASGAYIFRPNGTSPLKIGQTVQLTVVNTTLVQEVRQVVAPWLSQSIGLMPGKPAVIKFDFVIGPLPRNKSALETTEVVSRFTLDGLKSNGLFRTDANGRQLMQRTRNDSSFFDGTEPVAANYYPVNSRIIVEDQNSRMVVLTDRAQGGTSLADGQVELMIHRRAFWDDGWGVEEALDEPGEDGRGLIVRGCHWLLLTDSAGSFQHRPLALELFHNAPPQTIGLLPFDGNYVQQYHTQFSATSSALPPNVHLLTLRPLDSDHFLLRLEHFYQQGEGGHDRSSAPAFDDTVEVDIQKLFRPFTVISADELGLAANRPVAREGPRRGAAGLIIQLQPMEIRTFRIKVAQKSK